MLPDLTLAELTSTFPSLRSLDPGLRQQLGESSTPLRLGRGKLAFEEGSACQAFVLLTEGSIKVVRPTPGGREILLYRVQPGQTCVLTLSCLLEGVDYPARGIVEQDIYGAAVPRDFFLRLVDTSPSMRDLVFHSLSSRVVDLMALVEEVAFQKLDQRLARRLLEHLGPSESPRLVLTHQSLADELGSARENVSRLLGSFAEQGCIRLERGAVEIIDPQVLQRISRGV